MPPSTEQPSPATERTAYREYLDKALGSSAVGFAVATNVALATAHQEVGETLFSTSMVVAIVWGFYKVILGRH